MYTKKKVLVISLKFQANLGILEFYLLNLGTLPQ